MKVYELMDILRRAALNDAVVLRTVGGIETDVDRGRSYPGVVVIGVKEQVLIPTTTASEE